MQIKAECVYEGGKETGIKEGGRGGGGRMGVKDRGAGGGMGRS